MSTSASASVDSTLRPRGLRIPTGRIYNVQQAAAWLQIHPVTLRRLVERGQLKAAHIGDTLRIREEDLQALFELREAR